jgi:hypothetical protein
MQDRDIKEMIQLINECVKKDKIDFLAAIICKIQKEYQEICELSTDGDYQVTWTHQQVLDYLTYQHKC